MKNKKWLPLGIACIVVGVFIVINFIPSGKYDPFDGIEPDIQVCDINSERSGMVYGDSKMDLGDKGFFASVGSRRYDDNRNEWDAYQLSVQFRYEYSGRKYARDFFIRWVDKKDMPNGLWEKPIEEFASYDEATRTVTFMIGKNNYVCQLPEKIILPPQ